MKKKNWAKFIGVALGLCLLEMTLVDRASAFWLLGFSTADTQAPGTASFIGGTGGQLTSVGSGGGDSTNFTPYLAHAGIRFGLWDGFDLGYRLCTVALPYNSGGPSLGGEVDIKYRLSSAKESWRFAIGGGFADSFLDDMNATAAAWSPGVFFIATTALTDKVDLSLESRYVYTWVDKFNGSGNNTLNAFGESLGLKIGLIPGLSVRPEAGLFRFVGTLAGQEMDGWGFQYGVVLAAQAW